MYVSMCGVRVCACICVCECTCVCVLEGEAGVEGKGD